MPENKKFLDETGLAQVAEVVNGKARIFYGTQAEWDELTTDEKKVYDYAAFGDGGGTIAPKIWSGTQAEWDELPSETKVEYAFVNFTDDGFKVPACCWYRHEVLEASDSRISGWNTELGVGKILPGDILAMDINLTDNPPPDTEYIVVCQVYGANTTYITGCGLVFGASGYPIKHSTTHFSCYFGNGYSDPGNAIEVTHIEYFAFKLATPEILEKGFKDIYSTSEVATNKVWIDGKPIFRKVVDIGELPNTDGLQVNHGISNLGYVIQAYGCVKRASDGSFFNIPYVYGSPTYNAGGMGLWITPTKIDITVGNDRRGLSGYVVIEYTKSN